MIEENKYAGSSLEIFLAEDTPVAPSELAPTELTPAEPAPAAQLPKELEEPAMAMQTFKQLMDIFANVLNNYDGGKRQIVRAWLNAAVAPLNSDPLKFSYPAEKEIFDLFTEINSAKLILMVHGLADAGVLTLHKPLMESVPRTASEVELGKMMGDLGRQAEAIRTEAQASNDAAASTEAQASEEGNLNG